MQKSLVAIAPEDLLEEVQAAVPSSDALWGEREQVNSALNPLDDPLGGAPVDQILHTVTVILQTGTAAATFALAVVNLVNSTKKNVEIRDRKTDKLVIEVKPGSSAKQVEDAIQNDADPSA